MKGTQTIIGVLLVVVIALFFANTFFDQSLSIKGNFDAGLGNSESVFVDSVSIHSASTCAWCTQTPTSTGCEPTGMAICGSSCYDPDTHGCCGEEVYDLATQGCCLEALRSSCYVNNSISGQSSKGEIKTKLALPVAYCVAGGIILYWTFRLGQEIWTSPIIDVDDYTRMYEQIQCLAD